VDQDHPYTLNEDAIEGILKFVCRKEGLRDHRADDFCQWTRLKLIENDCAILRSFKGDASFKTFLVTVIRNKYRDWLDHTHGKFRVTAKAKKLGLVAINLERMILRDQMSYGEATQLLASKGMAGSIEECDEIWGQLDQKERRHFVPDEFLENHEASPSVDPLEDAERQRLTRKVQDALMAAIAALPPQDNLILRLRYWDQVSVAEIAKLQQIEQKPLYRRFDQLLKRLERDMVARGVSSEEVRDLFDELGINPDDFSNEGGK
jgi:RNA polymerase sigma factor (sigma-70 family)